MCRGGSLGRRGSSALLGSYILGPVASQPAAHDGSERARIPVMLAAIESTKTVAE